MSKQRRLVATGSYGNAVIEEKLLMSAHQNLRVDLNNGDKVLLQRSSCHDNLSLPKFPTIHYTYNIYMKDYQRDNVKANVRITSLLFC